MNIELVSDTEILLSRLQESGFNITNETSERYYRSIDVYVSSLAMCTFSVLASYGERIEAGVERLTVRLIWKYAEKPHRIDKVDMDIRWPEVPDSRLDAAMRAAASCTIHRTMEHSVEVETMIDR